MEILDEYPVVSRFKIDFSLKKYFTPKNGIMPSLHGIHDGIGYKMSKYFLKNCFFLFVKLLF
jgi:hypothetical protein